jgi:hypothetical protein
MRARHGIRLCLWKAFRGTLSGSAIVVFSAAIGSAQESRAVATPEAAPALTLETRISMSDVLNRDQVESVVAIRSNEIREITNEAELRDPANELLAARLPEPAIRQITEGGQLRYVLPYRFKIVDPGAPDRLNLRAVAVVEQGGLRVEPTSLSYEGSVFVGIENEDNPGAPPANLGSPVLFQIVFSAGSVDPPAIQVSHTNLPFTRVRLGATTAPESAMLSIRASFDPTGDEMEIPVIPLKVLSAPDAIPGLGFGIGIVSVQLPGFLAGRVDEVTLNTSRGYLLPILVPLSEKGYGRSELRSAFFGTGEATITVERADLAFAPLTVRLFWPWVLIIALFVGASVSGGLFVRTETQGGFVLGFLIGVVVGVAVCAGINLTGMRSPEVATAAVAFVFAAVPGIAVSRKIWREA